MVAREAMAYGRPVVGDRRGRAPRRGRRRRHRSAWSRRADRSSSGRRSAELLADPAPAAELGANARAAVARDYSWPLTTAALLEAYASASRRTR